QLGEHIDVTGGQKVFTGIAEGISMAAVQSPAQVLMLFDMDPEGARAFGGGNAHYAFRVASRSYSPDNTFDERHGGGDNISFVDGHVKWYRTSSLREAYVSRVEFETWEAMKISFDRNYRQ